MDLSGKYRSSPEALTPFPVLLWGGVRVAGKGTFLLEGAQMLEQRCLPGVCASFLLCFQPDFKD